MVRQSRAMRRRESGMANLAAAILAGALRGACRRRLWETWRQATAGSSAESRRAGGEGGSASAVEAHCACSADTGCTADGPWWAASAVLVPDAGVCRLRWRLYRLRIDGGRRGLRAHEDGSDATGAEGGVGGRGWDGGVEEATGASCWPQRCRLKARSCRRAAPSPGHRLNLGSHAQTMNNRSARRRQTPDARRALSISLRLALRTVSTLPSLRDWCHCSASAVRALPHPVDLVAVLRPFRRLAFRTSHTTSLTHHSFLLLSNSTLSFLHCGHGDQAEAGSDGARRRRPCRPFRRAHVPLSWRRKRGRQVVPCHTVQGEDSHGAWRLAMIHRGWI